MIFTEASEYLEQAKKHGIVPGLDSIRRLLEGLGNPQRELKIIHIAGTNGKGSVSAYVASVLKCGGYRVGRFLSPHMFDYRDMIQVNGTSISGKAFGQCMEQVKAACEEVEAEGNPSPTVFEIQTALGFLYFKEKNCDLVVLETGMGGLMDATNVVENTCVAAITQISRDHMKFLGNTLSEIAVQKAGIIKKGCHVVVMGQSSEVMEVIARKAEELECQLTVADSGQAEHVHYGLERQQFNYKGYKKLEITLAGKYQIDNALLALEILNALGDKGFPVPEAKLRKGMAEARWPGRFTILGKKPWFIVDGAHNEDGAKRLAQSLETYFPGKRILYIMGVLSDKEYERMIDLTHSLADQIITVTPPDNPRALPGYLLAQEIARVHTNVTAADSPEEAVEMAYLLAGKEDVILTFGSLSFLGRIIKILEARQGKK